MPEKIIPELTEVTSFPADATTTVEVCLDSTTPGSEKARHATIPNFVDNALNKPIIVNEDGLDTDDGLTVIGNIKASGVVKNIATVIIAASNTENKAIRADYVCDGVADEVEIQAAIDGLPAGGGAIFLLEGTYTIATSITIPSGKRISFRGTGFGTILTSAVDDLDFIDMDPVPGFSPDTIQEVRFSDFSIIATNAATTSRGIQATLRHQVQIDNIFFTGAKLIGVYTEGLNNARITNCFFRTCEYGVYFLWDAGTNEDCDDVSICGNDFSYSQDSAIFLHGKSGSPKYLHKTIIANNNIEESDSAAGNSPAIDLQDGVRLTIVGNVVSETHEGPGIALVDCDHNVIANNVIVDNSRESPGSYSGIELTTSDRNLISDNTIGEDYGDEGHFHKTGIEIVSGVENQIIDNLMAGNGPGGEVHYIDGGTHTIFQDAIDGMNGVSPNLTAYDDTNLGSEIATNGDSEAAIMTIGSTNSLVKCTAAQSGVQKHGGANSTALTANDTGTAYRNMGSTTEFLAGRRYKIIVWVYNPSSNTATSVWMYGVDGVGVQGDSETQLTDQWVKLTRTVNWRGSGVGFIRIGFHAVAVSDVLYLDDLSVEEVIGGDVRAMGEFSDGGGSPKLHASAAPPILTANSTLALYLDESGNNLKCVAKYSDGTSKTATIAFD